MFLNNMNLFFSLTISLSLSNSLNLSQSLSHSFFSSLTLSFLTVFFFRFFTRSLSFSLYYLFNLNLSLSLYLYIYIYIYIHVALLSFLFLIGLLTLKDRTKNVPVLACVSFYLISSSIFLLFLVNKERKNYTTFYVNNLHSKRAVHSSEVIDTDRQRDTEITYRYLLYNYFLDINYNYKSKQI